MSHVEISVMELLVLENNGIKHGTSVSEDNIRMQETLSVWLGAIIDSQ